MMTPDQVPAFNLKVITRETGLKADTVRAWERRYGLPRPQRTAGRQRLYSQRDIDTLKWLVSRENEGLSISRAVEMWRGLEEAGQDPLRVATAAAAPSPAPVQAPVTGDVMSQLRQDWLLAGLAFDEIRAERVLSQAFAMYPVETVCFEVLQKGLAAVGEGWYQGQVSVQQEHFVSELAVRRLESLLAATPPPVWPTRLLIACPPGEEHVFSPLLLTLLLRRRGWDVLYLGANVPAARMEATLNAARPQLVIFAAQHLPTAAAILEMQPILMSARAPLAYGGLIFNRLPALRQRIPGHFVGETLDRAPAQIEQWLMLPGLPALAQPQPVSEDYRQTLTHYRQRLGLIDVDVWQRMALAAEMSQYLPYVNRYVAQYITAALSLGDLGFLTEDMTWLAGILRHYDLPAELLPAYLQAYHLAVQTHLGERGAVITAWLEQVLAEPMA